MKIGDPRTESSQLLYSLGKVFLLFMAGMEINIHDFKNKKERSILFGVLALGFPLLAGVAAGKSFGYSWNASFLIGSLFASHTLLGLPIIQKLKLTAKEFWTITVGSTMLTDIISLLILGLCIMVHTGGFSAGLFTSEILKIIIYCFIVLVGLTWLGETLLKKRLKSDENQFLFVFFILLVSSIGAQMINLEDIVGAFFAGIVVNNTLTNTRVKEKIRFFVSAFFVPVFFIIIGTKINFHAMERDMLTHIGLISTLVVGFFLAKYAAAFTIGKIYKYPRSQVLTMWSLSMPQVAVTLTAAFVAYETRNPSGARLIDQSVLNSIFILMIITVIVGPILTERFGKRIVSENTG